MFLSNIWKKISVLPQHDGPQTAMNSLSLVEIILFIALDWEARSQLCMKAMKTKKLTHHNQDGKKHKFDQRYTNKKQYYYDLSKIHYF